MDMETPFQCQGNNFLGSQISSQDNHNSNSEREVFPDR